MAKKIHSYYWDTSTFLMVLMGESHHGPGVLDAARALLRQVELREAVVISSEIVVAEVLPVRVPPDAYERWEAYLQWPNLHLRGVDHAIARKACELRTLGLRNNPLLSVKLPDALHAATALIYQDQLEALHSLDNRLNNVFGHLGFALRSEKPQQIQLTLPGTQAGQPPATSPPDAP